MRGHCIKLGPERLYSLHKGDLEINSTIQERKDRKHLVFKPSGDCGWMQGGSLENEPPFCMLYHTQATCYSNKHQMENLIQSNQDWQCLRQLAAINASTISGQQRITPHWFQQGILHSAMCWLKPRPRAKLRGFFPVSTPNTEVLAKLSLVSATHLRFHICKMGSYSTDNNGLLWEINQLIYIKCLWLYISGMW